MVKKLSQLYLDARNAILTQEDAHTASLYARNLLCAASERTWESIVSNGDIDAPEAVCSLMEQYVARILAGEPLAYVLGQWDFYGMVLTVNSGVLIPRDDTCAVTELAIETALFLKNSPRILDLCTGSGCIGLAIAKKVPDARVTLADISDEALAIAKKNVTANKLSGRVSCIKADALTVPSKFLGKFEIIVSNPPYITAEQMRQLPDSVKNYEPELALYGGEDGLDFYRAILKNYAPALQPGGYICFEFGIGQGDDICKIAESEGYKIFKRAKDYNGIERALVAQYSREEE